METDISKAPLKATAVQYCPETDQSGGNIHLLLI
jgi:hypothetical protein